MGVHYKGWGVNEVSQYLSFYGLQGAAQDIFEYVVEEPANYLSYFIGYREFINLRDVAKVYWGDNFTLKKFHEVVLSLGPAPFDLLMEEIMEYK